MYVCVIYAGLFEQHKLLFSFSMTVKIQEVEESLNRDELDFFMKVRQTHNLCCQLTDHQNAVSYQLAVIIATAPN